MEDRGHSRPLFALIAAALVAAVATFVPFPDPVDAQQTLCAGRAVTILGTEGNDVIEGTPGPDVIASLGGSDRIRGNGGDDVICAGSGRDRVWGGAGNDRIEGGPGRDRILGQAGNDVVLGGAGRDAVKGGAGIDRLNGGRSTDTCLAGEELVGCEKLAAGAPGQTPLVDRVIHVSIDGLRPDHITTQLMPNLAAFRARSASTMNARTDVDLTKTLPNHTSQFTGRPVLGPDGHQITYNEDMGRSVHQEAAQRIDSVFTVVDAAGGRTAVFAGKEKFEMIDRSWDPEIDVFLRGDPEAVVDTYLEQLRRGLDFSFFHIRSPDEFGHHGGWGSAVYREGIAEADRIFGRLVAAIDADPEFRSSTAIIVVSDHGGPLGDFLHSDESSPQNYTIPFIVWAPGVDAGADLYALNVGRRLDPGTSRPDNVGVQPIRGHEVANLALDLLGLPPVPGSVHNQAQDLDIGLD